MPPRIIVIDNSATTASCKTKIISRRLKAILSKSIWTINHLTCRTVPLAPLRIHEYFTSQDRYRLYLASLGTLNSQFCNNQEGRLQPAQKCDDLDSSFNKLEARALQKGCFTFGCNFNCFIRVLYNRDITCCSVR